MPALAAAGLGKRFGGVVALAGVDLALYSGEVHALLGANGAGKSTLVKLFAGIEQPDAGDILVGGKAVRFATPRAALSAGIATVHQELSLFPSLGVAANILIGQEPRRRGGWIDRAALRRHAATLLAGLGADDIDPAVPVAELSLAETQLVEIAKALSVEPSVLILDEPTSALSVTEVERLIAVIERLRAKGVAIVFISHRLGEIERIADRVSILRSGEKVGSFAPGEFSRERALSLMLGEGWQAADTARAARLSRAEAKPVLAVHGLGLARRFAEVSFALRRGEVLGLAGLEGQGQKEVLLALFGLFRHGLEGRIELAGRRLRPRRPLQAIKAGIAFIPDDRKNLGGFLGLSISENIAIGVLDRLCRGLLLSPARESALVGPLMHRLGVVAAGPSAPLGSLSGGNQQKVVVAKWLARRAEVYVFCDPTRGVDAGARAGLFTIIRELAAAGSGVLFYSTDISEFPTLCSRVLVFHEGRISGTLEGPAANEENILALSFREAARAAA
ncbi:MAG: sugar ABC transporter ATP-binding protein [Acetobacteraceae bacterium]